MIPDIIELNFPKKEGKQYATLTQATANIADMGEKTITTQVKIDGEIVPDFSFDWEVEFQGEKYIMPLRIPQGAKENTSLKSTIDLTFQHWAIYQLKRWPFVTIQQIAAGTYLPDEEVATVQLNLKDFCILFGQVLEYYYGGAITIDFNDDPVTGWQYKQEATIITISHTKIWNVLIDAFHDKYGVRWEIKAASGNSNTVKGGERYVIRVGYPTTEVDHIFEYGFEGGLLKVERQMQSDEIRNMLKGRGGDTNIPFRYFKDTDPNNPDFRPDPDWVEELANIYFPNLMGATFRSYVQGWKAAHISKYAGYTAVGETNAYAPWAYRKGYTDEKFSPVEFVADEITIAPEVGDKQVEILPGYSPYVKKGSSLDKYGPLPDTLDNNDDYPTLQGTGLDIAVAVEQIESDDVAESTESDAQVRTLDKEVSAVKKVEKTQRAELIIQSRNFTVDTGKTANLDEGTKNIVLTKDDKKFVWRSNGKWGPHVETFQVRVENGNVTIEDASLVVVNAATGQEVSASGIQSGTYYFRLSLAVYNTATETYNVSVECPEPKLTTAILDDNKWSNTFDIWVKNIWNSTRQSGETDSQYSERVWKSVLGDRNKNTAKVVFTSGALAMSEDYEFVIVDSPTPDTSKTWEDVDGVTHTSHWRITLAKSDAELEATGLYVPSTKKQGKAGDTFVFIGTEMAHKPYVTDAEIRLDDWKKNQLGEVKEIKPTAVVTTDRVRLNNEGKPNALINQLRVGNSLRLFDKRFFNEDGKAYETLYLQSITYTYREPSSDDAALNPDVEIVLGEKYAASTNPVSLMQGEIDALQRQVGSISNIAQIVRAIGDKLYLRKDGISDRSLSPTQFLSLLTSVDFRAGLVGGAGWGFYQDENGNWVLETDKINARQDITANSLVINQVEGRGGMIVESAASMIVTRVDNTSAGYVCHFDQKDGSVANLFHLNDVAYCQRFTPENGELKYYRRKVTAIGVDSITLSKTDVDGSGIPEEGDKIVHFGNYVDKTRQYVKVRDVVNGGYERYIEGLDSVSAEGTEYYFVGRQYGLYGGKPRWFIGDPDGEYAEWINGKLNINGSLSIGSTIGGDTFEEYIKKVSPPVEQEDIEGFVNNIVNPQIENLQNQIDGAIETWFYDPVPTLSNAPANSWTTTEDKNKHLGDLYYSGEGKAYRFQMDGNNYVWQVITDTDITKALQAAKDAQDTADGKRRVFVTQPTPPYDKGDLWVNATYGTQYKNDILRCVTPKADGVAFAIGDWKLASKYTDDSALNTFIAGYNSTLNDIKTQIDGKAETWRQATDPSSAWTTADLKAEHKGDLWYNTTNNTTWYWDGTAWQPQDVPDSVFDAIDGKADIFVSKPASGYKKNDLWFLEADYTLSGVAYKQGTLVVAKNDMGAAWSADDWTKKDRYTDDTLANQVKQQVNNLSSTINGLKNFTDTAFSDGIIDRSEASAIQTYLKNVETAQKEVQRAYASLDANTLLPAANKTALANAKAAFDSAANALVVKITEVIADSKATSEERAAVNALYTTFNTKYGDFIYALNQANSAIMGVLNININKLSYLSAAMKELTTIQNGLILSSVVSLGKNNEDFTTQTTYSGISGLFDTSKRGNGIAAWYGGDMIDKFDYYNASTGEFNIPEGTRVAMALDRMDGTGYRANGNLWWDANGVVHADPLSFFVGPSVVGALLASFQVVLQADNVHPDYIIPQVPFQELNVADTIWTERLRIGDGYLRWDKGNRAFYVVDTDGNLANFYGNQLTAGGIGSGGSGGGGLVSAIRRWEDLGGAFSNADNDTFNAYTVNTIYTQLNAADGALSARVAALEGGSALSVQVTGGGNAVTDITKSGTTITATKGTTFLTQHQSLTEYLKKTDAASLYQPKGDYLTAITKAQVEAVLTGNITSHTHSQYLTAQSLSNYVTLDSEQTVTGHKIFAATDHNGYDNWNVPLTVKSSNHAGIEISCGSYTHGIGTHNNGSWYWWRADGWPTYSSEVNGRYIMQYDGTSFDFKDPVRATKLILAGGSSSQFLKADGSVDGNAYLPLTGGTMTGRLTVSVDNNLPMVLVSSGAATECGVSFKRNDENKGRVGWLDSWGAVLYTYSGAHKLGINPGGTPHFDGHTLWHADNDGAGSGLDADLLDGAHADDIRKSVMRFKQFTGTSTAGGYDLNTLAPDGGLITNYDNMDYWANAPEDASYGISLHIRSNYNTLSGQLFADIHHNSATDITRNLWWRASGSVNGAKGWGKWHQIVFMDVLAAKLANGSVTKVGTATVGSSIRPMYLNKGVPTAGAYAFGNASGNAAINNGTLNTNLNADMLDGLHLGLGMGKDTVARYVYFPPFEKLINLGYLQSDYGDLGYPDELYFKALLCWAVATYPAGGVLQGAATPISEGWCVLHLYPNTPADPDTGLPKNCNGIYVSLTSGISNFHTYNFTWNWRRGSYHGNASSATGLQYARAINGTSFDGTQAITTAKWGTARTIYIADANNTHSGKGVEADGSANFTLKLPSVITATVVGNADTATKLQTTRKLWGRTFDGCADVSGDLEGVFKVSGTTERAPYLVALTTKPVPGAFGSAVGVGVAPNNYGMFLWGDGTGKGYIQQGGCDGRTDVYGLILQPYGGNVGIGTEAPTCALDVNGTLTAVSIKVGAATMVYADEALLVQGNLAATGEVSAGAASDARLKDDIQGITAKEAIAVIEKLNPVTFRWNGTAYELGRKKGRSQGFLAHEYESVIPGSGRDIWKIYRAIDYTKAIPYAVRALQSHEERIASLEKENRDLKAELDWIKRAIA